MSVPGYPQSSVNVSGPTPMQEPLLPNNQNNTQGTYPPYPTGSSYGNAPAAQMQPQHQAMYPQNYMPSQMTPHAPSHLQNASHQQRHSSSSHHGRPSSSSSSSSRRSSKPSGPSSASSSSSRRSGSSSASAPQAHELSNKVKSQFYCDINFYNTVPAVPFEPKLVKVNPASFGADYTSYSGSSLEQSLIPDTLPDTFLDMNLSLVDADRYRYQPHANMGEKVIATEDTSLLSADMRAEAVQRYGDKVLDLRKVDDGIAQRSGYVSEIVLQKFLTTPLYSESQLESWARRRQADIEFAEMSKNGQKGKHFENPYEGLSAKEIAIKSFELVKQPPVHPKDPTMKPVEVMDILPHPDILDTTITWLGFRRLEDALLPGVEIDVSPTEDVVSFKPTESDTTRVLSSLCEAVFKENMGEEGIEGFGLYQAADAQALLGQKRDREEIEELEQSGPEVGLNERRRFKWVRELDLAPFAAIEPDNNFFFMLETDKETGKTGVRYSRYERRFVLRKRVVRHLDERANEEIRSRASEIIAVGASIEQAGVLAPPS